MEIIVMIKIMRSKTAQSFVLINLIFLCTNVLAATPANVQISTSNTHSCGITFDRVVECWGDNTYGQLGFSNRTGLKTRIPMTTLPDQTATAKGIATGDKHSCAIVDESPSTFGSGLVKCWGDNSEGQLGDGSTVSRASAYYVKFDIFGNGNTVPIAGVYRIIAGAAHTR